MHRIGVKPLNLFFGKNPDYNISYDQWIIRAYTIVKGVKNIYSKNDCDYIFGIDIDTGEYAIVDVEKIPNSGELRLSLDPTSPLKEYLSSFRAIDEKINSMA